MLPFISIANLAIFCRCYHIGIIRSKGRNYSGHQVSYGLAKGEETN